jgi:hypothetical protein
MNDVLHRDHQRHGRITLRQAAHGLARFFEMGPLAAELFRYHQRGQSAAAHERKAFV